jgi:dTDP-4-dehydrorhamnose 3,5-epimerase-like enzyme
MYKIIDFQISSDGRGDLLSLEQTKNVPFEIKRVYCLTRVNPQFPRGFHAHLNLQQLIVCLAGSCRFVLDDGSDRTEVWLDTANKGLLLKDLVWREMHNFSDDCVLMVLANEFYDEADYIRDYQSFLKICRDQS